MTWQRQQLQKIKANWPTARFNNVNFAQKLQRRNLKIAAKIQYENAVYCVFRFLPGLNVMAALLISSFFTFVVLQKAADFDSLVPASPE
jgi:hypothetical protein